MWLKVIIVILFIANVLALGGALFTLLNDMGQGGKSRTVNLLLIRVSLAALLLVFVAYGFYTGQLGVGGAPWAGHS
ncbi:MAG: DUF2909 domain-containing protein [Gammaproteobacteria bacterium]|jgi:hypothetical protein